jgi:hypothetical protein
MASLYVSPLRDRPGKVLYLLINDLEQRRVFVQSLWKCTKNRKAWRSRKNFDTRQSSYKKIAALDLPQEFSEA